MTVRGALSVLAIASLLGLILCPVASAESQGQNVRVLAVSVHGDYGAVEVMVDNIEYTFHAAVTSDGADPAVSMGASYASYPTFAGNPPYSAWWNGITNPPCIYIYLDSNTAFNVQGAIAGVAGLLALAGAIPGVGIAPGIAAAVTALISLDYSTIYGVDHNADGSLSIWLPADWFNLGVLLTFNHYVYLATPHYWWQALPGFAMRSNR